MKHLIFLVTMCLSLGAFSQKTNFFHSDQANFPYKYGSAGIEQMGDRIHSVYLGDRHSSYAMKWVKYDLSGIKTSEIYLNCPYSDYGLLSFKILHDKGLIYNGYGVNGTGPANFLYKLDSNGSVVWSLRDSIRIEYELIMVNDTTILCILSSEKAYNNILPGTYLALINSKTSEIYTLKTIGEIKKWLPHSGYVIFSQLKLINSNILISYKVGTLDTSCVLKLGMNGDFISSSGPLFGNLNGMEWYGGKYIFRSEQRRGVGLRANIFTLDYELKNKQTLFSNDTGLFHMGASNITSNANFVLIPMSESDSLRIYKRDYIKWYDPKKGLVRECKYYDKNEKLGTSVFQAFSNYGYLATASYIEENSNYFSYMLKTDSLGLVYNTDIVCECEDFNTGIESKEKSELHITVFPNPASERVVVQLPHDQKAEITLRNTNGQVIEQQLTVVQRNELDVSTLPRGIYLLEVKTEDLVGMRKIVVE
ncbi:MAG: T9SS type A sorting domain-containing protein [Flavobacteriales bacterium]|nr:T9SS type A sorting domain-containing protein [Flavobacteriales bacterium]